MADEARSYPTREQWSHRRVVPVPLEDDLVVDLRLPDLGVWLMRGKIPNPLKPIAEKIEYEGIDLGEMDKVSAQEREDFLQLQAFVIAHCLVNPNLVEELGEEAAIEWVLDDDGMPPEHRARLWLACFHVTDQLVQTLVDISSFRGERPGADDAADREGLRAAPE